MLVYYFLPFIVSNRYLLFWVSNGHNSVTVQNRTHIYMNFFDHKDLGNHLLQLRPKVVKHPLYVCRCKQCWVSYTYDVISITYFLKIKYKLYIASGSAALPIEEIRVRAWYNIHEGKAVPLQAWSGPKGSRKLRIPDFMTTAQDGGKVVSLTYRPPLPPGNTPGTHFC